MVSCDRDLSLSDPKYNPNICLHMFFLQAEFRFDTSFLTQIIVRKPFFYYGQ